MIMKRVPGRVYPTGPVSGLGDCALPEQLLEADLGTAEEPGAERLALAGGNDAGLGRGLGVAAMPTFHRLPSDSTYR
jgi:hypothetical protein